jgi:hypothetical protein
MVVQVDGERLLSLIGRTYDAALDGKLWSGLGPEIAETFNATSVSLRLRSDRTGRAPLLACTDNMLAVNADEYANSHFWRLDKWAGRAAEIGMSKVFTSRDLVADDELERSEWYWDWLRKADIFYVVGAVFPFGEDEVFSLGIHKPRRAGPPGLIRVADKTRIGPGGELGPAWLFSGNPRCRITTIGCSRRSACPCCQMMSVRSKAAVLLRPVRRTACSGVWALPSVFQNSQPSVEPATNTACVVPPAIAATAALKAVV